MKNRMALFIMALSGVIVAASLLKVFDPDTGGATGRGRTLFFKLSQ